MKRIVLCLSIFIFALPVFLKAEEITLGLDEAIAIALRDNRDVLLGIEEVKKAKEEIAEAKAGLLPTLDFTASRTYTRGLYPKDLGQTTTQSTLKQYLYKGGKTINTIEQNKYKLKVQEAILDKTKLETIFNTKKAFYTLLLAKEFAQLNKIIMQNTRAHLETLRLRYKNGQASESDILSIKESLGSVNEAYEASLNQVEASAASLRTLLYLEESVNIRPLAEFVYEPKEVAYTEGFLQAMRQRPEIRQHEAQQNADKKAIAVAKADNRPNIYASWDYYSRSTTSLTFSPTKGWQDYNIFGLTFSWPIFDGWETQAKVEQAIIDLKETQLTQEKTIKDIALEFKNAYLSLRNAIARIRAQEADAALYKDNLMTAKAKYKDGIVSALDLDDSHIKYEISLFNQKQAIYDYLIAQASFGKATGGI